MRNSPHLHLLAACVLAVATAHAETPAEQLTRIEAETAVLKATARKAEVQAQISSKRAEIAQREAEARRNAPVQGADGPQLRGIEGVGGILYATLELPQRGTMDVSAGDRLADGSRVVSIRPNEVVIETASKRRIRLTGGMTAAAAVSPSHAAAPAPAPTPAPSYTSPPPARPSLAQSLPALPDLRGARK